MVASLAALILVPALWAPAAAAAPRVGVEPKVVIIVGPSGSVTQHYREDADAAAAVARLHTASVTTIYSPDATWARVKPALQGASIVIYLGHGNGFPSRYRSAPWAYSENGLGLNVAGSLNDDDHQYYGEYYLRHGVKLAPNAVVILSHLCYASGNSEPGLPNDGLAIAWQRADNYAAGFIAAGASAVIADAHMGPAYYVDQVLRAHQSVADIWKSAPTLHGNVTALDSLRTAGDREYLDPDAVGLDFYRSLVVRPSLNTDDVLRGAGGARLPVPVPVTDPPPVNRPPAIFGTPTLSAAPAAGRAIHVGLPIASGRRQLPLEVTLDVRWDPLLLDDQTPVAPDPGGAQPGSLPGDQTEKAATWLVPEGQGEAVQTDVAKLGRRRISGQVLVPNAAGLYRLTIAAADVDGVDLPATQVQQPLGYLVRVIGRLGVTYLTQLSVDAVAGQPMVLPVRVSNSGADAWWPAAKAGDPGNGALVATWIALTLQTPSLPAPAVTVVRGLGSGKSEELALELTAPAIQGEYLVLLDLVSPDGSSMAALGVPPRVLHITVRPFIDPIDTFREPARN